MPEITTKVKGGDKLEAALKKMSAAASSAASVDIGFMQGATEPDGTSVGLIAALLNYGTRHMPPRPFFTLAVNTNQDKLVHNLRVALVRTDYNAAAALSMVGQYMQEKIQGEIRSLTQPALAESTIKAKGFAKPLIDTGTMLKSVTFKLNK
jgi:hypothetical protein